MEPITDYQSFWESEALILLQAWIEAGFETSDILELALDLLGVPLYRPLEGILEKKQVQGVAMGVRRALILRKYSVLQENEPQRVTGLWGHVLGVLKEGARPRVQNPKLEEVAQAFHLTADHIAILKLLFLYKRFESVKAFLDDQKKFDLDRSIKAALPDVSFPASRFVRKTEVLRTSGLVEQDWMELSLSKGTGSYSINGQIFWFIGGDTPGNLSSVFFRSSDQAIVPLDRYPIKDTAKVTIQILLKRPEPSLIFLHGEPGTGKSEFARSVILSVGLEPAILRFDTENQTDDQFKVLLMACQFFDRNREVIIVDEADKLLNTKTNVLATNTTFDKGLINTFFDLFKGKIIFISNQSYGIEKSVLRRFHFSLAFRPFAPRERLRIWMDLAVSNGVFAEAEIQNFAIRFQANPAQIRNTLEIARSLQEGGVEKPQILEAAHGILESTQKLLWGTRPERPLSEGTYDLGWLNLDTEVSVLSDSLHQWRESPEGMREGLNLLFYGMPGTGKTQFAHWLARDLGLILTMKRASDLVSPWVGETESNLREAFEDAEGGALLIDEADSFFTDRNLSGHSWERSQTNEILSAMEDFRGLFIATTNFNKLFDVASFRRFSFKIAFLPLRPEQRVSLLQAYFPQAAWSEEDLKDAASIEGLTPGDVRAVQKRLSYAAGDTGGLVINELRKDLKLRGSRPISVGFQP